MLFENADARNYAELEIITSFGAPDPLHFNNDTRARLKLGTDVTFNHGARAGLSFFQDGLGIVGFRSVGFQLSFSMGL